MKCELLYELNGIEPEHVFSDSTSVIYSTYLLYV